VRVHPCFCNIFRSSRTSVSPARCLSAQGGPAAGDSRDHRRCDDLDDIVAWGEHPASITGTFCGSSQDRREGGDDEWRTQFRLRRSRLKRASVSTVSIVSRDL
jgi:hypothetical protein